jgi:hypothetical protein
MATYSKDSELAKLQKCEKACKRVYGNKPIVLQQQLTGSSMAEKCAQLISAEDKVESANRAWRAAVAARDALTVETAPLFRSLQSLVQATWGKSDQMVAEFGFKPAEKAETSAETRALAVVKLRATRKARNTLGKQQRKHVTGTVQLAPALAK